MLPETKVKGMVVLIVLLSLAITTTKSPALLLLEESIGNISS